jgi:hypothetical protein
MKIRERAEELRNFTKVLVRNNLLQARLCQPLFVLLVLSIWPLQQNSFSSKVLDFLFAYDHTLLALTLAPKRQFVAPDGWLVRTLGQLDRNTNFRIPSGKKAAQFGQATSGFNRSLKTSSFGLRHISEEP